LSPDPVRHVALVTGGGGGVGRAAGIRLAQAGCDVVLLDRDLAQAERVAREVGATGVRAVAVGADVTDRAEIESTVARIRAALAPPTILVNAAGIAESSGLLPPDDLQFDRTMAVNVRGPWIVSTAVLRGMIAARFGRIVNVASTASLQGFRYTAAYVASKHALLGLTRAMALDLTGKGVTVNAVCPGFLDTPMTDRTISRIVEATGRTRSQALSDLLASGNQTALIPPEQVADAILALCADANGELSGAAVPV
jgi:NAD(P)-dependent dehydrogenase (short-subunit alcohol dehydrogenase family)